VRALPELTLDAWELTAVDFHVANILPLVQQAGALQAYSLEALQRTMWTQSSSTTDKGLASFLPPHTVDDRRRAPGPLTALERDYAAAAPTIAAVARRILAQRK
jgi:hypothetical protein